jgi:uncharacterized protein involved in exopolysaccharide biosynthesis
MYRRESRLEQLDAERKIARATYEDVASRYQGARLAAIARTPQLQVVAPALVPDVPEGRFLVRNVLLGTVVGTLLGCLLALGRKAVMR